jgi:hypothetical protein
MVVLRIAQYFSFLPTDRVVLCRLPTELLRIGLLVLRLALRLPIGLYSYIKKAAPNKRAALSFTTDNIN